MTYETFNHQAAQGDLLITKINVLPKELMSVNKENGQYILAHSETGHNHVVSAENVEAFYPANDDFKIYLVVKNDVYIEHMRGFDTHKTIKVRPGIYRINRQREYTPEGYRRAAD